MNMLGTASTGRRKAALRATADSLLRAHGFLSLAPYPVYNWPLLFQAARASLPCCHVV